MQVQSYMWCGIFAYARTLVRRRGENVRLVSLALKSGCRSVQHAQCVSMCINVTYMNYGYIGYASPLKDYLDDLPCYRIIPSCIKVDLSTVL